MHIKQSNNGILDDVFIDFPSRRELAIDYAEGRPLGGSPLDWSQEVYNRLKSRLDPDVWETGEFLYIMNEPAYVTSVIFIFYRPYNFLNYVRRIRDDIEQIGMLNTYARKPHSEGASPDVMCLKDLQALSVLASRSPYFELLIDPVAGQPDDECWIYFFARAAELALVNETSTGTALDAERSLNLISN